MQRLTPGEPFEHKTWFIDKNSADLQMNTADSYSNCSLEYEATRSYDKEPQNLQFYHKPLHRQTTAPTSEQDARSRYRLRSVLYYGSYCNTTKIQRLSPLFSPNTCSNF